MTKQDWLDAYECVKVSEDFVADAILLSDIRVWYLNVNFKVYELNDILKI